MDPQQIYIKVEHVTMTEILLFLNKVSPSLKITFSLIYLFIGVKQMRCVRFRAK